MELFNYIYEWKLQKEIAAKKIINHLKSNGLYSDIINRLYKNGYEIFITGGFIRDFLLTGIFSNDVDFVTNATPEQIKSLFYDRKYASGGQTFLVSFVDGIEIATYRKDIKNTGNRSECGVEIANTLEEDLNRRDFKINAIAFSPITGEFIDPHMGKIDLYDRKINFIGNPKDRINEDRERILRACRFIAVTKGSFGNATINALKENSHFIKLVAPERISLEIKKAMKVREASKFFEAMRIIGCLKYIFPSLNNCFDKDGGPHHNETIYQHCMDAGDAIHPKYKLTKLAGYLHDVGKPPCAFIDEKDYKLKFVKHEKVGSDIIKKELDRLRFSNEEIKFISGLIEAHMRSFNSKLSKGAIRRFLSRLETLGLDYKSWFRLFIADKHANRMSRDFTIGEIKKFISKIKYIDMNEHTFLVTDLSINGNDVMNTLGIGQCKRVGDILKECLEHCLDNPNDNNREFLLEFIRNL